MGVPLRPILHADQLSLSRSVIPWGRFGHPLREDLLVAQKTEEEGGSGHAAKFWDWSEEQVKPYL